MFAMRTEGWEPVTTPSQTVGPFFAIGLVWSDGPDAVTDGTAGSFRLSGRVIDGAGDPVPDALVETWQVGPAGIRGFGRCPTDAAGRWAIRTVKPPPIGNLAPHLDLSVFARGLLNRVVTRLYFPDEAANAGDPVLARVDEARRASLVAVAAGDGYEFDIHLQGPDETVFFAI